MNRVKDFFALMKSAGKSAGENKQFKNSVVISYYTVFSLPALLVLIINIAAVVFGEEAVKNQLSSQISSVVGSDTAASIQEMIANVSKNQGTGISSIIGTLMLIIGATGVLLQLKEIMNEIWEVNSAGKSSILKMLTDRVSSVGMILIIGFLLLVSLVLSAAVTSMSKWLGDEISPALISVFTIVDFVLSIGLIGVLIAAIFKYVPDIRLPWRAVWPGAFLTSALFVIAKFGLALYFAKTDPGSTYGAAGSIVLIMLWVTYSAFILGAEFVRAYVEARQIEVKPKKGFAIANEMSVQSQQRKTVRYSSASRQPTKTKTGNSSTDVYHYESPE
jgi:membrane protein